MQETTIAAMASAIGNGGISIIRISGSKASEIADRVFVSASGIKLVNAESHRLYFGHALYRSCIIDECMAVIMRAPRSYTCEDCVEIHTHGGAMVTKTVLNSIIEAGAMPAQPGEFTKRAFLNGRIDLTEAEAVMDVINSESRYALECSVSQMNGRLKEIILNLRGQILEETAYIEAALDDPEHFELKDYGRNLMPKLNLVSQSIDNIRNSFDEGCLIKNGIKTVIAGKPNAGKSSILNFLSGHERAIVTDIPGTTRDVLEERIILGDLSLILHDTAGIHETEDFVEKIGVNRAVEALSNADLVLFVVDRADLFTESDKEILHMIKDKKAVILLNKSDLESKIRISELKNICSLPIVSVSAKEHTGLEELIQLLKEMFFNGSISFNDQVYITNVRQKAALDKAASALNNVIDSITKGLPEDFLAIDLMDVYNELGFIIGATVKEDLIEEIFSKFCMGK